MRRSVYIAALSLAALLSGCGTMNKVAEVDKTTGQLRSERGEVTKATVVTSKKVSLAKFNGIVFVSRGGTYSIDQMKATGLFPTVLNFDGLQKLVVANNLTDKVSGLNEPIGLSRLAKVYKPFLWVDYKVVKRENKSYLQMIATNPENLEDLFVAEVYLDFVWSGVKDQNSHYPLFNSFMEWARQNP